MSGYGTWFVGAVVVVLVAVGIDRLVASGLLDRRPRTRRRPTGGSSAASGAFGDLVEIFQPSRVHVSEELARQVTEPDLVGDSAPPIDLDGGVAHLPAPTGGARTGSGPTGSTQTPAPRTAAASGSSATDVGAGAARPTTNPPGAST